MTNQLRAAARGTAPVIDRRVRVLDPKPADGAAERARRFSEFATEPNIVLLGNPGAGKTVLFEEAARVAHAQYVKARFFRLLPAAQLADALFIDALDEQRAVSAEENSAADKIVEKLFEREPKQVRISCREQDWLGDTDLAVFATYFRRHGGAIVLRLEPIDRDEQVEILVAKGINSAEAAAFITEAERRGMSRLLQNPRKMLLLRRVTETGVWPDSVLDLFRRATEVQLTEENEDHARSSDGRYTAAELRLPAGGVCAARLISDSQGICLGPNDIGTQYPSYRSLSYLELPLVRATLRRPLFTAAGPSECVDYDHRTSAEFLAAEWIADRVRHNALPIGRVLSLMGADGHPAAELRGLNAWLPLALPEYAGIFIAADPLGVLEYGDAASLQPSMRAALLEALAEVARENPWFLGRNRSPIGIEHLVQPDSIASLCAILETLDSPRDLRTLVLEAFEAAPPQQDAFNTLLRVFTDAKAHWHDRYSALTCLHAFGAPGRSAILAAYPTLIGAPVDVMRLRGRVLALYYGQGLAASDIIALFRDLIAADFETSIGLLWNLADALPLQHIPGIVDAIAAATPAKVGDQVRRSAWDTGSFVNRLMTRVSANALQTLTGPRVLAWIDMRRRLKRMGADDHDDQFIKDIRACAGLPRTVFEAYIDAFVPDKENPGRDLRIFYETVSALAVTEDICDWCIERAQREKDVGKRDFVFGLAAQLCRTGGVRGQDQFERIYADAQGDAALGAVLAPYLVCDLEFWRGEHHESAEERRREREEQNAETREEFRLHREQVRTGQSGLIHFAADIYFDMFYGLDQEATPAGRLAGFIGEDNAEAALDGFRTFARPDHIPPNHDEILRLVAEGRYMVWWRTLAAGVDAMCRAGETAAISEKVASALLLLDLFENLSMRLERGGEDKSISMHETLKRLYPDAANSAYVRAIEFDLERDADHVNGLYAYLEEKMFHASRRENLIPLLARFSNTKPNTLEHLIGAALAEADLHDALREQAAKALSGAALDDAQRQLWLATAYMLQPEALEADVRATLAANRNLIWPLRDFLGYESRTAYGTWPLSPHDLGFLIAELGAIWPSVEHPSGWSGNRNSWDATECLRKMINTLSAIGKPEATHELEALIGDARLAQYRNHLKYALAQHRIVRREAEYDRPDWARAINALANQAPANAADLHALVLDHLHSLTTTIDGNNDDQFKFFWNETPHGATNTHKPEESCRDVLISMLRPRLAPLGLNVEPEGHMSANKRVDIAISRAGLKCVIEVKLAHSPDLWSAVESQLDHLYTRDPDTKGYGILLTLWFGAKSKKPVTKRGSDGWVAPTPAALEAALHPEGGSQARRIGCVVVNVSGERARNEALDELAAIGQDIEGE